MKEIKRYWRSLCCFWSSSIAAEFEYPLNAWVELLSVLGNLAGSIFVLKLLFGNGVSLGGWSWNGSLIVLGLYTILDGFTTCVLQPNLSRIVNHIQTGTLDYVLLKPIDSQFWLSTRTVSPWGLPGIIAGFCLISLALIKPSSSIGYGLPSGGAMLLAIALLIASLAILYSLWFVLAALSIWFIKVWNATEVLRYTLVAGRYPVSAYPPALRLIFTFVLPVAFLTTIPAEALLGKSSSIWAIGALGVAGICLTGSRLLWNYAQRFYTSASS